MLTESLLTRELVCLRWRAVLSLFAAALPGSSEPAWEKHELQSKRRTIFKEEPVRILTLNGTWINSHNELQGFTLPMVLA